MYINPVTLSNQSNPAPGLLPLTPEQESLYIQHNGFIKIISTDPVEIEPDVERWEAWKAAEAEKPVPPVVPSAEERLAALESAMLAMMGGTTSV